MSLKKTARRGLRNLLGVDVVRSRFDEGWTQERDYWLGVLRDFYQSAYGLTWGRYFRVCELRSHYRDQSHLICKREA